MIDPKILQQHFKNVQQRGQPPEVTIPRIPDPKPLTAIEPIPEIIVEPEIKENETLKQALFQTTNIELSTETIPVSAVDVEEKEPHIEEKESEIDDYNPYGYYFGPKF